MAHKYGDSHQRLSCTPDGEISKPRIGLCVTCKHHGISEHPFMSFPEVHGAQFLTCKVRTFRSVINGVESDWCHDIRRDNAHCAQWEQERSCHRCAHACFGMPFTKCSHPSFAKKFTSGEFKGHKYYPDAYEHSYGPNFEIKFSDPQCGKDAPLWKERK